VLDLGPVRPHACGSDAAELAAHGCSNKAIAAELVLSVRSVENRLQHVYEKLAISGRAELTEALRVERA
jgi:DNA-binding NarL/FixJ family response regulator